MSDKWVDGNDGWAYYNEMIGVNGHTENFLTSITLKIVMMQLEQILKTFIIQLQQLNRIKHQLELTQKLNG